MAKRHVTRGHGAFILDPAIVPTRRVPPGVTRLNASTCSILKIKNMSRSTGEGNALEDVRTPEIGLKLTLGVALYFILCMYRKLEISHT